jgi:hypothetical protein
MATHQSAREHVSNTHKYACAAAVQRLICMLPLLPALADVFNHQVLPLLYTIFQSVTLHLLYQQLLSARCCLPSCSSRASAMTPAAVFPWDHPAEVQQKQSSCIEVIAGWI